ncbi:MAG: hypothetical protein U0559_07005 [Anaerolineae bacterium]
MAKKAVTAQERLEQLIAGATANPTGPGLNVQTLQGYVTELNGLEAALNQAKQAQKAATQVRDDRLKVVLAEVLKAELAVKAHYGPKSPKVKEYILSAPKAAKKPAA